MVTRRLALMVQPMLATLASMPAGSGWQFEFKWDGVRAIIACEGGKVQAISRNNNDFTASYPELLQLPQQLGDLDVVLDGEIVALDGRGVPSFSQLQQRMHIRTPTSALLAKVPVSFCCFDLLAIGGTPTTGWSYLRRREALEAITFGPGPMQISPRFDGPGEALLETARSHGLEGLVAKAVDSVYQPGMRSRNWIKVPINHFQEGVIIGWRAGEGKRSGTIGSLLLAAHDTDGLLHFIGAVGTGFTQAALAQLQQQLEPLEAKSSPANGRPVPPMYARGAHWVQPKLVGETQYRNLTPDGTMRHPSWRGLRSDRAISEIKIQS